MNRLKIVEVGKDTVVGVARGGDGPGTVMFTDGTVATIAPASMADGNETAAPLAEVFEAAIEKVERTKTPFLRA